MKPLSVIFSIVVIWLLCTSCNAQLRPEDKAATDILAAVASSDASKFDWITYSELKEATGLSENELDNSMFSIIKQKDKFHAQVNEGLRELKTQSEKIGIDWNNYGYERVEYSKDQYSDGMPRIGGKIFLKSNGKEYQIEFKDVVITKSGEWKYLQFSSMFESAGGYNSGNNITSNTVLNQEGDFDTFLVSLADCFAVKNYSECRKIVLTDNKGKPVIKDVSMIDFDFYIDELGVSFKEAVKNKNFSIEEQNPAQLLEWFDGYALDEDELFNKSEVTVLKSGEGLLSGIYFTYKEKWYVWQIF